MAGLGDTQVPPGTVLEWIGGGIAAFLLAAVVLRIIDQMRAKRQQRTVTSVAVTAGVVASLGLSPFGTITIEVAQLSQLVPTRFPAWVSSLVAVETGIGLLYGLGVMWESGGFLATGSFTLALVGGVFLPNSPAFGFVLVLIAWVLMELSPADRW